jgi:hypothetical protein
MTTLLRGNSAEAVLEQLAEVEECCGSGISRPPTAQPFRKLGNWLVSESHLNDLIFQKQPWREELRLPGLVDARTPGQIAMLFWRRYCARKFLGYSSAEAIRIKSNGRAFYLKTGRACSVKFLLAGKGRRPQNLRNEVETRLMLSAGGLLNVPEIFSYGIESSPYYICEELLCGRRGRPEDAPLICEQLIPQLTAVYRQQGWNVRSAGEVVEPAVLLPRIECAMRLVEWRSQWILPAEFLRHAERTMAPGNSLICSLGHGDFSLSNTLITSSNRIYVVDWEMAGQRPVLFDLRKVLRHVPAAKPILRGNLEQLTSGRAEVDRPTLSVDQQLFLGALSAIGDLMGPGAIASGKQPRGVRARLEMEFEEAHASLGAGGFT